MKNTYEIVKAWAKDILKNNLLLWKLLLFDKDAA